MMIYHSPDVVRTNASIKKFFSVQLLKARSVVKLCVISTTVTIRLKQT